MDKAIEILKNIQDNLEQLQKLNPKDLPKNFHFMIIGSHLLPDGTISETDGIAGMVGSNMDISIALAQSMRQAKAFEKMILGTAYAYEKAKELFDDITVKEKRKEPFTYTTT